MALQEMTNPTLPKSSLEHPAPKQMDMQKRIFFPSSLQPMGGDSALDYVLVPHPYAKMCDRLTSITEEQGYTLTHLYS